MSDNDWCIRYCLVTKQPLTLMFFSQHPDQLIVIIYYGLFTIKPVLYGLTVCILHICTCNATFLRSFLFANKDEFDTSRRQSGSPSSDGDFCTLHIFIEHYVDNGTHEQLLLNMFHRAFDFYKNPLIKYPSSPAYNSGWRRRKIRTNLYKFHLITIKSYRTTERILLYSSKKTLWVPISPSMSKCTILSWNDFIIYPSNCLMQSIRNLDRK